MKRFLSLTLILVLMFTLFVGCSQPAEETEGEEQEQENGISEGQRLILATTTSTQDSGLLDYILPEFEKETGITVDVVAVGTGQALEMGKNGEADILLVHAKASEEEFVSEGHGLERRDVMYNDYILVGPKDDPAKLKENYGNDIVGALKAIAENKATFVSRGDDSGTHKKELALWKETGITPEGDWYLEAGSGMGDVLAMANEELAYTISDRATYLSMKDTLDLEILVEGDENLFNQYGIIPVNPDKNDKINAEGAQKFMEWLLSDKTQELIGSFGVEEFGQPLFTPNAK
ncbi:MAG: extracellular solute-binding protein [Tissierellia bacterium]|nr:extracellular solute-binding protein [Tissierellia bacterium]